MHEDERVGIGSTPWISRGEAMEELAERQRGWDSEAAAEELCEQILQQQPGLDERELWRALVAYRQRGSPRGGRSIGAELASADHQKLCERVRLLIGLLPQESLEDFSGLVAFTQTFSSRVQFVCDLMVYLFAEREKGLLAEGTEGRRYVEFFVQKLMWELDVVSRIGEQQPLSELEGEYLDWLTDRILDGEVLL
jgi:hypothetical protein